MREENWYMQEELWTLKKPIIFNKERVRNTFLEVNRMLRMVELPPEEKILDLGCGMGRHCQELASRGFNVTGIDITAPFLQAAMENALSHQLSIRYIQGDMRKFSEPDTFGLIINMFTSFGYFEDSTDDITVLQNCYRSLRTGGSLMLEMLGKEVVAATIKPMTVLSYEDYKVIAETSITNNWSWLECKWTIIKDQQLQVAHYAHRLYAAAEMIKLLENTGFREVKVFGDLTGSPYDNTAKSMLLIAKK